jgi:hypothetical protein
MSTGRRSDAEVARGTPVARRSPQEGRARAGLEDADAAEAEGEGEAEGLELELEGDGHDPERELGRIGR